MKFQTSPNIFHVSLIMAANGIYGRSCWCLARRIGCGLVTCANMCLCSIFTFFPVLSDHGKEPL